MGTKNDPGEFDCYTAAEPDEPIFTLRANDRVAPMVVAFWAALRHHDFEQLTRIFEEGINEAVRLPRTSDEKFAEALRCGEAMMAWKRSH